MAGDRPSPRDPERQPQRVASKRESRGLAGWTVYVDPHGNGALDAGEPSPRSPTPPAWRLSPGPCPPPCTCWNLPAGSGAPPRRRPRRIRSHRQRQGDRSVLNRRLVSPQRHRVGHDQPASRARLERHHRSRRVARARRTGDSGAPFSRTSPIHPPDPHPAATAGEPPRRHDGKHGEPY